MNHALNVMGVVGAMILLGGVAIIAVLAEQVWGFGLELWDRSEYARGLVGVVLVLAGIGLMYYGITNP